MNQALQEIISKELTDLGLDLADLSIRGTRTRQVVDVRIDRQDGMPVKVDDCAAASRAIEARLDETKVLGDRYVLEVSSAGLERPLRTSADWVRFVGRRASIVADAVGGRAEVDVLAVDGPAGDETVTVRDLRLQQHRVRLADVREARLVFHWTR